jgi:DNA-directed RNA polymerase specialized sigma24 family protein
LLVGAPGMNAARDVDADSAYDFGSFYSAEYERLVRLAYLLVGSGGDPEGLAQEAFTRVHPRFLGLRDPRAYARATLVNLTWNGMSSGRVIMRGGGFGARLADAGRAV